MNHFMTVCEHGKMITQCRCMQRKQLILAECVRPEQHKDLPVVYEGKVGDVVGWVN